VPGYGGPGTERRLDLGGEGDADRAGGSLAVGEIARAWPEAELIIIDDSSHTGSTVMTEEAHAAADRLYKQITKRSWALGRPISRHATSYPYRTSVDPSRRRQ
jgi:hypothetical protein